MEPSLRSSRPPVSSCKLSRTDQSLHETTQRFVESLSKDVRVGQYADPAYAAKKFSDGTKWQWLSCLGRQGYLVFLPKQPIVWLDDQFKKSFKIPLRVSAPLYEKKSVFLASLNLGDGELRIEDCWMLKGQLLRGNPFSQRWNSVLDFFGSWYREDSYLQRGLRVSSAEYKPLMSVLESSEFPSVMLAQGETAPRRLRVQLSEAKSQMQDILPSPKNTSSTAHPVQKIQEIERSEEETDGFARAVPHPEYPDTYDLFVNSMKKGYAAVQDLKLSRRLREATSKTESVRVKIEWNEEFKMLEIIDLA